MVVVLTHKEMSCLVVAYLTIWWARFCINIVIFGILPALFALIRPCHKMGPCLCPKSYNILQ